MKWKLACLALLVFHTAFSQQMVSFLSADSLTVYADHYFLSGSQPYIILLHQEDASRGEFREIAPRLNMLGYNCLAVDLRYGKEMNYTNNLTAHDALVKGIVPEMPDAEMDIDAAVGYIEETSGGKILLLGSSFSASLAMKAAMRHSSVQAVIAFSPGEYFEPGYRIRDLLSDYEKPVLIASSVREAAYMKSLADSIPEKMKTLFVPTGGRGEHGARALWSRNPTSNEYWMAVILFIRMIRNGQ